MKISSDLLHEGEKGIAIRNTGDGKYHVVKLKVSTGFHGTRRYSSRLGAEYKTEKGARKSLNRWKNYFSYYKYKDLGTIDNTVFRGELNE